VSRLLTVPQFAEGLGVTVSCIRRWLLEGKVAKVKLGRLVRIPAEELQRLVVEGLCPARQQGRSAHRNRTTRVVGGE